jgi:hypothetical protein
MLWMATKCMSHYSKLGTRSLKGNLWLCYYGKGIINSLKVNLQRFLGVLTYLNVLEICHRVGQITRIYSI